jgi:UDP-N-acetylglucosamine acyltransferase
VSSTFIHPSAVVEEGVELGLGCHIGPFCHVGKDVSLGDRVVLKSHVVVTGRTDIGDDSTVFPFAVLGEIPQDKKFKGEQTRLLIGARNCIREHVTMNTGTEGGGGITQVGNDRIIVVNNAAIGGHCIIEDDVLVGGLAGIHQFVRIGRGAIIGALTMVTNDVIPYGLVQAPRGQLDGLNLVGLKRRGVSRGDITALRAAFQMLAQGDGTFQDRAKRLGDETDSDYVQHIVDFVTASSDRSFLTPGE